MTSMKTQALKSNILLLLAAAIWGFAFVAQRVGMQYIGPFTFNGIRFALGSISLLPLMLFYRNSGKEGDKNPAPALKAGLLCGVILFFGASLQQLGLVETEAGKAAFITGLYIVLVPLMGVFLKRRISFNTWLGAVVALGGLYLLCITDSLSITNGDLLELAGSIFWAAHIIAIDHFSRRVNVLRLACFQFMTCSVLSLASAAMLEEIVLSSLLQAAVPILYGGICSVGVAYTLQVVGQRHAEPAHAAIILSMETIFAVIGGYLLLRETLGPRALFGCALMFAGMLLAQVQGSGKETSLSS